MIPTEGGRPRAFMTTLDGPLTTFDSAEDRWRVVPMPFDPSGANPFTAADVQAVAPDGRGGLWVVQDGGTGGPYFHRYTDRRHRPVFDDAPHPMTGRRFRGLAGAADGTVWLAGEGGRLAQYDRLAGWSTRRIRGWDDETSPPSAVTAVALGPDGTGVAVGERGQVATFDSRRARLQVGPGAPCAPADTCRTGKALRAVDVAPDGSALIGGDGAALLWRAAGATFQSIRPPPIGAGTTITGVALPTSGAAWIATADGRIFAGRRAGDAWEWGSEPENAAADRTQPLRAIAVAPDGTGYAVGDGGTVLELRDGAWRRVALGVSDDFTSVALSDGEGSGALIGAAGGAVWTRVDGEFQLARPGSTVDGYTAYGGAQVSGLALLPGTAPGQTEAWVALDVPDLPGALLHYSSHPDDPLLTPKTSAEPLPDSPPERAGEVSFVALGKSDCANSDVDPCPGPSGTDAISDVIPRRIAAEVKRSTRRASAPLFSVFTGDVSDHGGDVAHASRPALLNEWVDVVARPLDEARVPILGAIGVLDLSDVRDCASNAAGVCTNSAQATRAGANVFWRQAMVDRVGQDEGPQRFGDLRYRPVRDDALPSTPDVDVPGGGTDPVPSSVPTGGARTHYAVDVLRGGEALVRLVFVDNSLGSLRASDPLQQPPEPRGQLAWLDRVLGSRPKGSRAVVVSTSPSYTYRPETVTDVADDGASFEEVVLRHGVSAVVSGRVGWNALYYTLAPGLHCPSPGGAYPEHPPSGTTGCGRSSPLPGGAPGLGAKKLRAAVPFVISSSAGGKLARESGDGYWHGYSVIRLDASGDPAKTIVEQRPILDWLVVTADDRRLRPGERVTLKGVGREPVAADTPPRYHRIANASITHRYDLLVADPQRPWLPYRDEEGDYVALSERHPDCSVGCVDRQSGEVRTGEGADERVYAVALLSVGKLAATYPLVFEPRSARKALALDGGAGAPAPAPAPGPGPARPAAPASLAPQPPATPTGSLSAGLDVPALPTFPPATPPDARVPEPPAPPTPQAPSSPPTPAGPQASATSAGLAELPRVSPVPPGAPHAKPSPKVSPGREEADPEQAAIARLDADDLDAAEAAVDPRDNLLVDIAPAPSMPPGAATTRRAHERTDMPMTALSGDGQPSAWVRGAGYAGGLTLAALVLAGGWLTVRPRRRPSPAPALTNIRHNGR